MARDLGEDIHKIFELPIRVFQTFYGISSCCRAIRQIVLAPCVAKAERGNHGKKKKMYKHPLTQHLIMHILISYLSMMGTKQPSSTIKIMMCQLLILHFLVV